MDEFTLIGKYFAPLAKHFPGSFHLSDDAAALPIPPGKELVVTTDAIVQGIHFFGTEPPASIAKKALRVNLSDLAAMGATPHAYFLTLMLPVHIKESWIANFAKGLKEGQKTYGISLAGGDTNATQGPLSISVTALGLVNKGRTLRRNAAKPGDIIYVSGSLGDAALGLLSLKGKLQKLSTKDRQFLEDRYFLPQPRVALGQKLHGLANACMDISDGLVQDLGHICDASACAAEIEVNYLPCSGAAKRAMVANPKRRDALLSGGDDYELLFTVPKKHLAKVPRGCTRIGTIKKGSGILLFDGGKPISLAKKGYRHFA